MTNVPQPPGENPEVNATGVVERLLATLHEHTSRKPKANAEAKVGESANVNANLGESSEGDEDVIRLIRKDRRGSALWQGQWEGLGLEDSSHSGADFALMQRLAFYTGKNPAQMDGLFRRSALYREAKWDSPRPGGTYGSLTIDAAIAATTDVYSRKGRTPLPPVMAAGVSGSGAATAPALASPGHAPDLMSFEHADGGNAERMHLLYGPTMFYSTAEKSWYVWSGGAWRPEDLKALALAHAMAEEFLRQARQAESIASDDNRKQASKAVKFALETLNRARMENALALLAPMVAIDPVKFDRPGHLLNFRNGTVDLRTGEFYPHRKEDLLTKQVDIDYDPAAKCPEFMAFLARIMGHSPDAGERELAEAAEKIEYLQLALGYSITGETSEKAVFIAQGEPDTGKTTLLTLVHKLLGPGYAVTVPLDAIIERVRSSSDEASRASLRGARFAQSDETEQGQRMSTAMIKRLSQGSGAMVTACRKYENPITFPETHKIWIDANYRPELAADDDAAWRRLRLVPFTVKIPDEEQDQQLGKRLLANEAPGILAWLAAGSKRWYASGLAKSQAVDKATGAWRDEVDRVKRFMDEAVEAVPTTSDRGKKILATKGGKISIPSQNLYHAFKDWAEKDGELGATKMTQIRFSKQVTKLGYQKFEDRNGTHWDGILFRTSGAAEEDSE